MADDDVQAASSNGDAPRRSPIALVVMVAAGLAVGLGGGVVVVGPVVAERVSAPRQERPREPIDLATVSVENLVLNPAETMGTRFLLASLVLTVEGSRTAESLRARDPEVRDRLMSILGSKTVDELSDVALREPLKEELRVAVESMVEPSRVVSVFLPTFVIQ